MIPLTVIFFSCSRIHLLRQVVDAFLKHNTYYFNDIIIVNDSGNEDIHEYLKSEYPGFTLVLNSENVGLIKSIDIGYSYIKTDYFFHCEDDWMITKGGFIEKSMTIMESRKDIEEVWLCEFPNHPMDEGVFNIDGVEYRLASENVQNSAGIWHGFSTAIGLKRKSDYLKVAPYSKICGNGDIWQREGQIGVKYHELGYRTAILTDRYAENIGYGQSEYITGFEK
jgi:hypothetical protein